MLGTDAREMFRAAGHEVIATDARPADEDVLPLDITDADAVRELVTRLRPDWVLHAAAYTDVDGCERNPELAHKVNAHGTENVAQAAEEVGATLIAVSTDFVFDGEKGRPYTEADTPKPISHYGASKWAGEQLALASCSRCFVLRTAWLYGVHGKCFPYTVLRLAQSKPELPIVSDQTGTPTFTRDFIQAALSILQTNKYGTYHVANGGAATWAEFARTVLSKTGHIVPVREITSAEYATMFGSPTRRPAFSVLEPAALLAAGLPVPRPWPDALDEFLARARDAGKL